MVTVLGLVMTLAGAVGAATDLRPRPMALVPEMKEGRMHRIRIVDEARRKGYVSPPYEPEAVEAAMREADRELNEDLERERALIAKAERGQQSGNYVAARNGMLLIALGSVVQILGVISSSI